MYKKTLILVELIIQMELCQRGSGRDRGYIEKEGLYKEIKREQSTPS
jgi:hypothetical protein